MEKGSKEWFAKLEENYNFPTYISFFITNDNDILSGKVNSKANDENNLKYEKIRPPMLTKGKAALLGVHYVANSQNYYDISEKYAKHWIKG